MKLLAKLRNTFLVFGIVLILLPTFGYRMMNMSPKETIGGGIFFLVVGIILVGVSALIKFTKKQETNSNQPQHNQDLASQINQDIVKGARERKPSHNPHICWLNLIVPGLAQMLHGQVAKGILLFFVSIVICLIILFGWLLIAIVSIVDAYMVGKTLSNGKEVRKWQWFPK